MSIHYDENEDQYWITTNDGVQYFISPLAARDGLMEGQIKESIDNEVALITNWLRLIGMTQAALAIEAGDYKK